MYTYGPLRVLSDIVASPFLAGRKVDRLYIFYVSNSYFLGYLRMNSNVGSIERRNSGHLSARDCSVLNLAFYRKLKKSLISIRGFLSQRWRFFIIRYFFLKYLFLDSQNRRSPTAPRYEDDDYGNMNDRPDERAFRGGAGYARRDDFKSDFSFVLI